MLQVTSTVVQIILINGGAGGATVCSATMTINAGDVVEATVCDAVDGNGVTQANTFSIYVNGKKVATGTDATYRNVDIPVFTFSGVGDAMKKWWAYDIFSNVSPLMDFSQHPETKLAQRAQG
ncbi:hypothetical protein, partial [Enterobacter hormaechei]|uniref:hypothetical protein n=1 Tax=Enterobacter hormaechei TaxID=158836 RepID=UPI0018693E8A